MSGGIYTHIGYTYPMQIVRKKGKHETELNINLKRLTLGEWLSYVVNLRAWKLCDDWGALAEICESVVVEKVKLTQDEQAMIVKRVEEILSEHKKSKADKDEKTKPEESWVSDTIAFFAVRCGWKKEDVLGLYYDEIHPLMESVNNIANRLDETVQDRVYIATAYAFGGGKGAYQKNVVDKRHRVPTREAQEKLEKLKAIEEEFLGPIKKS